MITLLAVALAIILTALVVFFLTCAYVLPGAVKKLEREGVVKILRPDGRLS